MPVTKCVWQYHDRRSELQPVFDYFRTIVNVAIRSEDDGFSAQCIEFPGIITQADTESELREMIGDAVDGYFEAFPEEKDRLEKIKKAENKET